MGNMDCQRERAKVETRVVQLGSPARLERAIVTAMSSVLVISNVGKIIATGKTTLALTPLTIAAKGQCAQRFARRSMTLSVALTGKRTTTDVNISKQTACPISQSSSNMRAHVATLNALKVKKWNLSVALMERPMTASACSTMQPASLMEMSQSCMMESVKTFVATHTVNRLVSRERFARPQITNVFKVLAALLIAVLKNVLKPALTMMILFVDLMGKPTFAIAI